MDEKIFHLINEQWTNPAFDLFMPLISYAEIWTPFFLIAAVAARCGGVDAHGHVAVDLEVGV